ncbi:lytic murein transglycosylase [Desulfovibrio sp. X2]|uniref:lytic murein transglycosylase n=1 Tax=Desulfovibrio sp. X2 TaxID=941449 RepID=UPI001F1E64D6|nr:lytic murein transglycosylase [Desulfovibrio sp. X2]
MRHLCILAALCAALCLLPRPSVAAEEPSPLWQPLIDRLAEDGLPRDYLDKLFSRPEITFQPRVMSRKMIALLRSKTAPATPPSKEAPSAPRVYERYLQPALLADALRFMDDNRATLDKVEQERGVSREVVVAIMLVETRLGSYLGNGNAFVSLASMALCDDFLLVQAYMPMNSLSPQLQQWLVRRTRQKADWAYEELVAFIEYAMASGQDPLNIRSSPYGAIGLCQFMPSNAVRFGVDGNNDGVVDLFDPADALPSIANYLAFHGWKPGLTEERQERVIYHYNHDETYARTIVELSKKLKEMEGARN